MAGGVTLSQDYGVLDTAFLLQEFKEKKWVIVRFAVTLAALALVFTLKPHYPIVKTTLRVDPPAGVAAALSGMYNVDTEIGSIKSHGMVAEALAQADYYALVTPIAVKEAASKDRPVDDRPGAIQFEQLYFPKAMEGREWVIEILDANRFALETEDGKLIAEADIGELITGTAQSRQDAELSGKYRIEVSAIEALPGSRFSVKPMQAEALIGLILSRLDVTKRNSAPGSNLLDIELSLPDVTLSYYMVATLAEQYIVQSIERQSAAQRMAIRKLEDQLEEIKVKVEAGKQALLDFYADSRAAAPELELRNLIPKRSELQTKLQLAEVRLEQLKLIYTDRHPAIQAVREEIELLSERLFGINASIAKLPQQQSTLEQLERELTINTDLYQTAIKELAKMQLATNSLPQTVHLIDWPRVYAPGRTKYVVQLLIFGGMLGLICGLALVLLSASVRLGRLHRISQLTGLTTLPVNQAILTLTHGAPDATSQQRLDQLAQYSYHHSDQQWMGLSAAKQNEQTAKLCLAFAQALGRESSVLLIDAHLFESPLAPLMGGSSAAGLAELLTDRQTLEKLVQTTSHRGVSYLPAGKELVNYELLRDDKALRSALEGSSYNSILVFLPSPVALPNPPALLGRFDRIIHWLRTESHLDHLQQYLLQFEQVGMPAQSLFVYEAGKSKKRRAKVKKVKQPPIITPPNRPTRTPVARPPKPSPAPKAPASGKPKRVFLD